MLSVSCRWLASVLGRNVPVPGVVTLGGRVRLLVYPTASPNPRPPPAAPPGRYPPGALPEQTGGQLCPFAGGGVVPAPVAGGRAGGSAFLAGPSRLPIPPELARAPEQAA